MVKVGVIGLGMMGQTHLEAYAEVEDAQVVAVAARQPERVEAKGNMPGQSEGGLDLSRIRQYTDAGELIADEDVELVDICSPTPLHYEMARAALKAGKHVLLEKPVARTAAQAAELAKTAEGAEGYAMPAMCMRFWPGWVWLKQTLAANKYGALRSVHFRRLAPHPGREHPLYGDAEASGGAILDLHLHDTDFVQFLFGVPRAVTSFGYKQNGSAIDHVLTRYEVDGPAMVVAEGGWLAGDGMPFQMQYVANFDRATAVYDLNAERELMVYEQGKEPEAIDLVPGTGWQHEIGYFLKCIQSKTEPQVVTMAEAADATRVVEAEVASVERGQRVEIPR